MSFANYTSRGDSNTCLPSSIYSAIEDDRTAFDTLTVQQSDAFTAITSGNSIKKSSAYEYLKNNSNKACLSQLAIFFIDEDLDWISSAADAICSTNSRYAWEDAFLPKIKWCGSDSNSVAAVFAAVNFCAV